MMNFTPNFIANISAVDGEAGLQWLRQIDGIQTFLQKNWSLRKITPLSNLSFNFVAIAELSSGEKAVLKMSPAARSVLTEVSWLKSYAPMTPKILNVDKDSNAFLMELCEPGIMLKDLLKTEDDELVTRKLCHRIRELRKLKVKGESFKHISDLIPDLEALNGFTDPYLHSKAVSLFTDLTRDRSNDILLHADLHHENILKYKEDWKIIDPHGYRGDPTAEVGVMIYNPIGALPMGRELQSFIDRRIRILAEELGDDLKRIQAWCYCKTMLSAAWNTQDFKDQAKREIEIGLAIDQSMFTK